MMELGAFSFSLHSSNHMIRYGSLQEADEADREPQLAQSVQPLHIIDHWLNLQSARLLTVGPECSADASQSLGCRDGEDAHIPEYGRTA
jgi:hypothetical protein